MIIYIAHNHVMPCHPVQ